MKGTESVILAADPRVPNPIQISRDTKLFLNSSFFYERLLLLLVCFFIWYLPTVSVRVYTSVHVPYRPTPYTYGITTGIMDNYGQWSRVDWYVFGSKQVIYRHGRY